VKKISLVLVTVFIVFSYVNNSIASDKIKSDPKTNKVVWHTNLEKAIEIAEKENKPILMQFSGSDWCHFCIRLNEEVLKQKEFVDYAKENMILVNIDFPLSIQQTDEVKNYNQEMLKKYGVRGYPTVLLLDKSGKVVYETGFRPGGVAAYITHIKNAYITN
jgi:protein disulfide-isomerase